MLPVLCIYIHFYQSLYFWQLQQNQHDNQQRQEHNHWYIKG